MVFRPRKHLLSDNTLSDILDDLMEVSYNANHREAFRNRLLYDKLRKIPQPSLLTESDVRAIVKDLTQPSVSTLKISRVLTKLSRKLEMHYAQLTKIFNGMR